MIVSKIRVLEQKNYRGGALNALPPAWLGLKVSFATCLNLDSGKALLSSFKINVWKINIFAQNSKPSVYEILP